MADDKDSPSGRGIVRKFSHAVYAENPDDDLTRSLVAAEATTTVPEAREPSLEQQWIQLFSLRPREDHQSQDEIILAGATEELAEAYKKFLKCLPKTHETRIEDGPPRLQAVSEALKVANEKWKNDRETTKAGRARSLFSKIGVNLHKFRELFAVVPSSDKYVSLLAGSLSAIIKATVNHTKIAESVSKVLDDLSEDIAYWKELLEFNERSARAEHYVARLYVLIFKFLATIMVKWASRSSITRLMRSFDSDFFGEEIEEKKAKIRDLGDRFRRYSEQVAQSNTKNLLEGLDRYAGSHAKFQNDQAKSQERFNAQILMQVRHLHQVGWQMKEMLEDYHKHRDTEVQQQPLYRGQELKALGAVPDDCRELSQYTRVQVQQNAIKSLGKYATQQDISSLIEQAQFLGFSSDIFFRIREWNASMTSQLLWICGPFMAAQPSKYTLLSAYIVMTAQKAAVPVIYHFCSHDTSPVELLYSLVGQLLQIIQENFESEKDFSASRFDLLDRPNESIDSNISLIENLLSVCPHMLLLVIDGLQWLDEPRRSADIKRLLDILRSTKDEAKESHLIKLLCTTDGASDALNSLDETQAMTRVVFHGNEGSGIESSELEDAFL